MLPAFGLLAKLRFLRGTPFDPFGWTQERRGERALVAGYRALVEEILQRLEAGNHALAVELAGLPEHIRGFGPVKARHLQEVRQREAALLARLRGEAPGPAEPLPRAA
jgi:indolepyruvate ferredoxin oxidoreductase